MWEELSFLVRYCLSLLLHCQIASRLWWEIQGWFGLQWVIQARLKKYSLAGLSEDGEEDAGLRISLHLHLHGPFGERELGELLLE